VELRALLHPRDYPILAMILAAVAYFVWK